MRADIVVTVLYAALVGCSADNTDPARQSTGDAGDGQHDAASPPDDPCSVLALSKPTSAITYYVALNEPGADNAACDGLSATDQGGGHCPFRDFDSERTRAVLVGAKSTRVEVRAGTYVIRGWDGLRVEGSGTGESERLILSAYQDEQPVLDVAAPDGDGCTAMDAPSQPQCVRQVLRIAGQYTTVQGLTIQNGLGYHVEINGGAHQVFRCNTLHETVDFPMRSDMLKIDGHATDIEVLHNDFSRFRSQAIDLTAVVDVLIEDNEFHDPVSDDAGATGTKYGSRGVIIRGNRVHDLGSATALHAFSLGGTGSGHPDDHAAYDVHVVSNRVWNIAGILAQVVSCVGCSIEDNDLWNAGAGVHISSSGTASPECESSPSGCGANMDTRITGNRMRDLDGGGDAAQANVFVLVDEGEAGGFVAGDNLYCAPRAQDARFGWNASLLDFDAWQAASATDATSSARASDDADCMAFYSQTSDATDAGKDHDLLQPTQTTALDATIGGVLRMLHRAQFGVTKEGTTETLYFEAHEGGVADCPETVTPKRTMIVNGVPKGAPGERFDKSDGVTVTFLDFVGDQIADDNPTTAASAATITIVALVDGVSAEIEVESTFPDGTATGRIYATYCASLSQ